MASETTNYKLVKPDPEEFYDVGVQNSNLDKIDTALKELEDSKASNVNLISLEQTVNEHLAEHLRIEIGVAPPEKPNSKTFWLEDLGESIDFVLGSGLLIGNASTDGSNKFVKAGLRNS